MRPAWLSSFINELEKISRATLTWDARHDPLEVPPMQPGMYPFAAPESRGGATDRPGFNKPPLPAVRGVR